jgi:predicted HTH transcriptional regulator
MVVAFEDRVEIENWGILLPGLTVEELHEVSLGRAIA